MRLIAITIAAALLSTMAACGQTKDNKGTKETKTVHITTQQFKEKVYDYDASPDTFKYKGDKPAIVDFFATWCGPCRKLSPILDEIAEEYDGKIIIYKVDIDENEELARTFGIRSIPTLLYIPADGEPSMTQGAPSKAQLKEIINKMIQ